MEPTLRVSFAYATTGWALRSKEQTFTMVATTFTAGGKSRRFILRWLGRNIELDDPFNVDDLSIPFDPQKVYGFKLLGLCSTTTKV